MVRLRGNPMPASGHVKRRNGAAHAQTFSFPKCETSSASAVRWFCKPTANRLPYWGKSLHVKYLWCVSM
jgi:hypothetical protein